MGKAYDIFNRKLFSLPKLIILPGVISRQPMLLVKIFPFIFLTDMLKGRIVASVTDKVEQFQREARDVNSIRQKVEQFDMKNAELVSSTIHLDYDVHAVVHIHAVQSFLPFQLLISFTLCIAASQIGYRCYQVYPAEVGRTDAGVPSQDGTLARSLEEVFEAHVSAH